MKKKSYRVAGNWPTLIHHNDDDSCSTEQAMLATLCVIRDELQRLNRLLSCPNFTGIPATLRGIRANTTRRKKRRQIGKPKLRVVNS